jgi:hypothetical protein
MPCHAAFMPWIAVAVVVAPMPWIAVAPIPWIAVSDTPWQELGCRIRHSDPHFSGKNCSEWCSDPWFGARE